jgi:hypothetical protein
MTEVQHRVTGNDLLSDGPRALAYDAARMATTLG